MPKSRADTVLLHVGESNKGRATASWTRTTTSVNNNDNPDRRQIRARTEHEDTRAGIAGDPALESVW